MKIAVLAWGSLVWDPRDLKIVNVWKTDGPFLPIEFARISMDGRLTLVIRTNSEPVQVLWTLMQSKDLDEAILDLKNREGTVIKRIGYVDLVNNTKRSKSDILADEITNWALEKGLDAVIWTDLGMKFKDVLNRKLNAENVIKYLSGLPISKKARAREYIENAPVQVRTALRSVIEEELGWKK